MDGYFRRGKGYDFARREHPVRRPNVSASETLRRLERYRSKLREGASSFWTGGTRPPPFGAGGADAGDVSCHGNALPLGHRPGALAFVASVSNFARMTGTLLNLGHGYCSRALAGLLLPQGWRVIGTTRSPGNAARLAAEGVETKVWPGGALDDALGCATHLLVSAAPGEAGDPFLAAESESIAAAAPRIAWAGYLSTTGVYGDRGGGWVDETTPPAPSTERGRARTKAEAAWRGLAEDTGLPLHIFRLAGIYGPGRGPFAKVRAGTARRIVKEGQVFSRIHVDDVAQTLAASIARPDSGAVYNLCDDEPAPPEDVISLAAELLGLPVPPAIPFESAEMTPMARSFYAESKRVSNDRIKRELGVKLIYPSYRDGLAALLERERRDGSELAGRSRPGQ